MITLSNGHQFEFCCASGALGYDGDGWWFEQPWRWFKFLRPEEFTIITKTLTYLPRAGNLRMWCPWRCVQPIKDGFVNSVGLTNPGYQWWLNGPYQELKDYKVITSIMPDSFQEAADMATDFNEAKNIVGIEINVSCPNVKHESKTDYICSMVEGFAKHSDHPVILKLSCDQPYVDICRELDGKIQAFDLINAVPWHMLYPDKKSPLAPYGLVGGVSGRRIREYARTALTRVKEVGIVTPIISGGGIDTYQELLLRKQMGAGAISFGTIFIRKPWLPNRLIARYQRQ